MSNSKYSFEKYHKYLFLLKTLCYAYNILTYLSLKVTITHDHADKLIKIDHIFVLKVANDLVGVIF